MGTKRKERDEAVETPTVDSPADGVENAPKKGATLFIQNLPYTATSVDLETLFSDIAPVRSAFVVLDKETRKSKGVGYVSFALKEDAATAVEQIQKNGITLDGRSLRVLFADSKFINTTEDGMPAPKPKPAKQPKQPSMNKVSMTADPKAIRTIVISGLPSPIDKKTIWKKVRKVEGAEEVSQFPVNIPDGKEDPTSAEVVFLTPANAMNAVSRLHAHVFKGSLISVVLKKRLESLAKSSGHPSRGNRLIVRNLPWNATEDVLRRLFLPYGPIHSIDLPVSKPTEEGGKPRAKGFGFVWMMNKKDAEAAIEGANGTTLNGSKEGDSEAKEKARERVIAVDWALSKDKWEEEKEKIMGDEVEKPSDSGSEAGSSSESGSENSDEEEESDDDNVGVHEDSDSDGSDEDEDSEFERSDEDEAAERPQLPPPETGNTVFIRNLPFDATEDELRTLFRTFGPLRYARITMDPASGRSRGTGFACFWNKEDADKAIQQAELLKLETGGLPVEAATKKNPFKISSILMPDPTSSLAQSLVLHGRTLDVTRAVTREEAARLREVGEKQRQKQDKRNMYLMREGVIFPNSPAAATLTETEVEKRVQAFNTRRTLMRSNPSLFISKTRLSVRQLPVFATERTLKRLALHAVRAFEEDVKKGLRQALTADELHEDDDEDDNKMDVDGQNPKKRKRKQGERATAVRQAKIVRLGDRVDPIIGKGRSKGYGFLELMEHANALRVLRWANNNPDVEGLMKGWWKDELQDLLKKLDDGKKKTEEEETRIKRIKDRIKELEGEKTKKGRPLVLEFSIENIQVVRRRAEHQKDNGQKPEASPEPEEVKVTDRRPSKKARKNPPSKPEPVAEPEAEAEAVTKLGSMIGRKRRMKKFKAKGR
ncbi:hypothetical protein M422DRAFT_223344 [Sphaerobolus stellatus SS14]|nr:hypothetical protein M422DRAFT_223344 [Sphaerobolus stellatus SS14]